jgi:ABC-type Fe3+ transport system substrate-binding protein
LIDSGEIPMSPTIFDANVAIAKQKESPVEWRPLEPVVTTVGSSALMAKAPNPHTALLFIDFLLSKEGQQLIMKGGLWSPREDIGTVEQKFKKPTSMRSIRWKNSRQNLRSGKICCGNSLFGSVRLASPRAS